MIFWIKKKIHFLYLWMLLIWSRCYYLHGTDGLSWFHNYVCRTVLWFCSPAAFPIVFLDVVVCVHVWGDAHALWRETKAFPPLSRLLEGRSGLCQQLTEEMTTPPVDRGSWRAEGEGSAGLRTTAAAWPTCREGLFVNTHSDSAFCQCRCKVGLETKLNCDPRA